MLDRLDRLVSSITGPDKVWTHWQWYKVFFHIAILRYLVLWFAAVPVLAKLLQKVPHELTIALGDRVITLAMRLPFTWELLWVCSFTYVIALFLYNIVCPRFVKEYSSYAEYKAHMHSPRWIIWQARELVKDNSELPKLVERLKVKRYLHKVTDSSESGKGSANISGSVQDSGGIPAQCESCVGWRRAGFCLLAGNAQGYGSREEGKVRGLSS